MKVYTTWEEPFHGRAFSEAQMETIYESMVDKKEYPFFSGWLSDMLRSGVYDVKTGSQDADPAFTKRLEAIRPILGELLSNASGSEEPGRDEVYARALDLMYAVEKYLDDND